MRLAACRLHRRFLRPEVCATCAALATTSSRDIPHPDTAVSPTVLPAADPDGPLGPDPHDAHLLGQLAARLLDQVRHAGGPRTRQLLVDLDDLDASDPIDVYNALLQAAGAFTQNQQLRTYLDRLGGEHARAALTAAQMWELLRHACAALERHPDLSDRDRELLRVLGLGGELLTELDAARQMVAALDALEQAKTGGDADQVRALRQRLAEAREEYRAVIAGHVHAPIGP